MKHAVDRSYADNTENFADATFSDAVIHWQEQHGRHTLPWQKTRDAYRVWLSEIMLQQTQVAAVIPYYQRFLERFPTLKVLAAAPSEAVMAHWSGLGYYSRARNLHQCAQHVVAEYDAVFPRDPALLIQLPGIGRSTAAAIAAFSYGTRAAILDGNVKRVFSRVFGVDGYPGAKRVEDQLWQRAEALLPENGVETYTQGLMDLGATLCTRTKPACTACPIMTRCVALATDRVHELPMRKPKKALSEKHVTMLVIVKDNQVLMQKRPPHGIWGGLLSLPELGGQQIGLAQNIELDPHAVERALMPFGVIASKENLSPFTHVFTHFKLYIAAIKITLSRRLDIAGQTDHLWINMEDLPKAPLPAPVKKLLLNLLLNT